VAEIAWLNGRLVGEGDAVGLDIHDRGLLLGDGLFETLLLVDGRPVLLEEHLERLLASAAALGFDLPDGFVPGLDEGLEAVFEAVADDGAAWGRTASLRITLTRGPGPRGLVPPTTVQPTLLLQAAPADPDAGALARAAIIDVPRIDPLDPLAGHKTTSALRWVLARRAARKRGADVALLHTTGGDVAEADAANLFVVIADAVMTPPLSRGVLPGTTRAWAIATLRAAHRVVIERPVEAAELLSAGEVFLTSSLLGVRSLGAIDGATLPGHPQVGAMLRARWRRFTGQDRGGAGV